MYMFKFNSILYAAALSGAAILGCVAETSDEDITLIDPAIGIDQEEVGEVQQALDTCTPPGSGGGTWGDILTLCVTPDKYLYVMKRDGSAFTSTGTLELRIWLGTIMSTSVFPGQKVVYFGKQLPSDYWVLFTSGNGGTAYTGSVVVP